MFVPYMRLSRSTDAIVVADTPRDEDEELRHPAEEKNASGVEPELITTDPCRLATPVYCGRYSVRSWSRRCAASLAAVISAPASDVAEAR